LPKATPSPSPSPSKGNKNAKRRSSNTVKQCAPPPNVIAPGSRSEFLKDFGYDIDGLESEDMVVEEETRTNRAMISKLVEMGARSYETVHGVQRNNNQTMTSLTGDLSSIKGQVAAQDSRIKKQTEAQKRTNAVIKELQDKVGRLGRQAAEVDARGSDEEKKEMEGVLAVIRTELQGVRKLAQDAIAGLENLNAHKRACSPTPDIPRNVRTRPDGYDRDDYALHDRGRRIEYTARDNYMRPSSSQAVNGYRRDRGSVAPPDLGNGRPTSRPPSATGTLRSLPPWATGAQSNSRGDPMQVQFSDEKIVILGPYDWVPYSVNGITLTQDVHTLVTEVLGDRTADMVKKVFRRLVDPTTHAHVCFATRETAEWFCRQWANTDRGDWADTIATLKALGQVMM
ncbi:hypothetical protein ARMSODRAFT_1028333, partial [Armillaria solidipes]